VVRENGEQVTAWVYWFRGHVKDEQRIASGDYQELIKIDQPLR
jgi:hypothetical protein